MRFAGSVFFGPHEVMESFVQMERLPTARGWGSFSTVIGGNPEYLGIGVGSRWVDVMGT